MRALYQRAYWTSSLKESPQLIRVGVDLDDELDLQCRQCLIVVVPLYSVDYHMRVLKNEDQLGSNFLVLRRNTYHSLSISKETKLLEEEPFECIYVREVICRRCSNSLGWYFETTNIDGTAWLASRIAINLEAIVIMSAERNLVEPLKQELQKLSPLICSHLQRVSQVCLAEEKLVTALLQNAVDGSYPQNKMKHSLVEDFTSELNKFDKGMWQLEMRARRVIRTAELQLNRYQKVSSLLKTQARLIKRI